MRKICYFTMKKKKKKVSAGYIFSKFFVCIKVGLCGKMIWNFWKRQDIKKLHKKGHGGKNGF